MGICWGYERRFCQRGYSVDQFPFLVFVRVFVFSLLVGVVVFVCDIGDVSIGERLLYGYGASL